MTFCETPAGCECDALSFSCAVCLNLALYCSHEKFKTNHSCSEHSEVFLRGKCIFNIFILRTMIFFFYCEYMILTRQWFYCYLWKNSYIIFKIYFSTYGTTWYKLLKPYACILDHTLYSENIRLAIVITVAVHKQPKYKVRNCALLHRHNFWG